MDGNLERRVPVTGAHDDFDHLSETLNEMLDRIQGLIGNVEQVTNDIAHDLRTPLGRLRQRLEQVRTHASTTEDYARAVDTAIQEADGLLSTFTALLRIAQVEAGGRREFFRQIDLSEVIRSVIEAYEPDAEDTCHQLVSQVAAGVELIADRDLITQLFANLIENGLAHTPEGATITVTLEQRVDGITASVADNGPGVPPEERERIFQRFYRMENSRTNPGTGLGLSLVAAVAKLHGAHLTASDNHPGLRISLHFSSDVASPSS
jgi:signal transduction histidine kinase